MDAYRMPKPKPVQPCWYCVHWAGPCWGDPYLADCRHDGDKRCVADAPHGCVHWEREPGSDDDGWAPAPLLRPRTPVGRQVESGEDVIALAQRLDRANWQALHRPAPVDSPQAECSSNPTSTLSRRAAPSAE